jgi:hypothetical protein
MALNALMSLFVKVSQFWARGVRCQQQNSTRWVEVVRCQQQNSTRWVEVTHKIDFLSTVLAFSSTPISVLDSGFGIH